jgi:radical SAM protein with 4Fe4S-binding SPASM domain
MKKTPALQGDVASDLVGVTVCPLQSCNLGCAYCYQDTDQVVGPRDRPSAILDPVRLARGLTSLLARSKSRRHAIVISGGEPLLLPEAWYRAFFSAMDGGRGVTPKKTTYSLQTNMLRWDEGVMSLLKERRVHFSVHYDGRVPGASLRSEERRRNIERLHAEGFSITAIVVGTGEALARLPATLDLFRRCGVKHYHLNHLSTEGRGARVLQPDPERRADAEFESAFFASQSDFATWDPAILNKFVGYATGSRPRGRRPSPPVPQRCGAGRKTLVISAEGLLYPCGFFPRGTGPMGSVDRLPGFNPDAGAAIALCEKPNRFFEERCPACRALPICGDYCALTPTGDSGFMRSFCESQRSLMARMDGDPQLVTFIARRYGEYRLTRPDERPTSCGVIYRHKAPSAARRKA